MAQTATVQIQMPEMGESVTEGIVLEWHVAEGDFVNEGDTVVEISTDKVDAEVPAPTSGVITKLIAQVDEEVPVGAPLAEMEPGKATGLETGRVRVPTARLRPVRGRGLRAAQRLRSRLLPRRPGSAEGTAAVTGVSNGADGVRATPVARRVAAEHGVDLRFWIEGAVRGEGDQRGRACCF